MDLMNRETEPTMTKKTMAERFQAARKLPSYWIEKATLDITSKLWSSMRERQLTQVALAQKVDKKAAYVSRVMNGNHNVTLKTLVTLAHALEMEVKFDLVEISSFSGAVESTSTSNPASIPGIAAPVQPLLRVVNSKSYDLAANGYWEKLAA
jgi:transcriptional regulator with XRE-family HTH domain